MTDLWSWAGVLEKVHFTEVISQSDHLPVVRSHQGVDICPIWALGPDTCYTTNTETHQCTTSQHCGVIEERCNFSRRRYFQEVWRNKTLHHVYCFASFVFQPSIKYAFLECSFSHVGSRFSESVHSKVNFYKMNISIKKKTTNKKTKNNKKNIFTKNHR